VAGALRLSLLEGDVYLLGLRGTATERHGDLPERLLEARRAMQARLASDPRLARLVEHFDPAPTTRTRPWPRTCCSACRSTRGSTWPTSPPTRTCARPSTPRA
jgi:hypothetical protein